MTYNGHRTLWTFAITSIALFIADLDRKILECHEQAKKLGTALY